MTVAERMNAFLIIAAHDQRLSALHLGLYLVLCALQSRGAAIYFSISRSEIMRLSKIRGIATYHKIIRELHAFGYVDYVPSYHPAGQSLVRLNDFTSLIK